MMPAADLLSALAHGLLDAAALSAVLALVTAVPARLPGIDAATRSRCWSAVAVVPLLALAAALCWPPIVPHALRTAPVSGAAANVLLIDPLDTLQRGAARDAARSAEGTVPGTLQREAPRAPLPLLPLAVILWLPIAAYRIARVGVSVLRADQLARAARVAALGPVERDLAAARVTARLSDEVGTPVAVGLTRRTVILPAALAAHLPAAELRAVVLHEIAHLRRRDDWVYLLERLAAAVLWFDPIVFIATRVSASGREMACDAAAARAAGGRVCATALWRSAGAISAGRSASPGLALLSGAILVDRIEALLYPAATSPRRALAVTLALAVFASAAGTVAVMRAPAYASPGAGLQPTGSMRTRRASFVSVKLRDGRVLVAGGMIANHDFTPAAELYDPARGTFEPTGSLLEGRVGLSGTVLRDGRVLIAGGWTTAHGVTGTTEVYDPATSRFTAGPPMHSPRAGQTATLLRDGAVLICGGGIGNNTSTVTAEVYDPATGRFSEVGSMHVARASHTATLLRDGRVLVAGGGETEGSLRSTELYDPAARRFSEGPPMHEPRSKQGAELLGDGSVLVVGGGSDNGWASRLATTERYDPAANRFVAAATMHERRFKLIHSTVRLPNGDVLVAGGGEHVELYETARDRFRVIDGPMENARNLGGAVLLDDGSVLIAGGYASVDPLPTTDTALRYRSSS